MPTSSKKAVRVPVNESIEYETLCSYGFEAKQHCWHFYNWFVWWSKVKETTEPNWKKKKDITNLFFYVFL